MTSFTLKDLGEVLTEAAGSPEVDEWDDRVLDTPFHELGYDSLALLEMSSRVQRSLKVTVPDEAVVEMKTPRLAVAQINSWIGA